MATRKPYYDALNAPQYPSFPSLTNPIQQLPQLESGLLPSVESEPTETLLEIYELPNGARGKKIQLADGTIVNRRSDQSIIFAALAKWKDKVRKGRERPFENEVIPAEVVEFVNTALKNTYFDVSHIFEVARYYVQNGAWLPLGASEDETRAYYANLRGEDAIARVIAKFLADMAKDFKATPSLDINTITAQHYADLQRGLVGTLDNPQGFTEVYIAAYGQDNPQVRQQAIAEAQDTLDTMLAQINHTTAKRMQEVLASGASGQELDYLIESAVLDANQNRARNIARDQNVAVYNEANIQKWERAGVQEVIWQTVRDSKVCQICEEAHNKRYNIKQGYYSPKLGAYIHGNHAHPECRCFARPDDESIDFAQIAGEIVNG